ncbi:hypothetical protein F0U44_08400 [Nocardioides humilatus]|uniref:DUF4185 domain-containing protein n=1 Tax=Nocardioides humilatus TaxID=2607660 RepID=A0A5B1LFG8_9ACTN|nr:hypothetical protein [Nocardioides humilatus]KAA1418520.1 hypothetical protein F0U44_08400 [Nocardioides humilatus]
MNTVPRRSRWKLGIAAVVAATLSATLLQPEAGEAVVATVAPTDAVARADALDFAVQLGPEQRLIGPTGQGDNPYFSETRRGKLYGYFGTSRTIEWKANGNKRLTSSRIILDRGLPGRFDDCGAWMVGSFQKITRRHWIAFYHAEGTGPGEDDCDHYANTTVWRMAMAETTNGGLTWRRPSYPNNVVLTGVNATSTSGRTNAGNGRVVKVGSFYYMFFETNHGTQPGPAGVHIARAAVTSDGMPGAWKKWYCHPASIGHPAYCAFDEAGIGGHSTPIGGISEKARHIVWNSSLNRWLGFDASGRQGFRLFASPIGAGATADERMQDALIDSDGQVRRWDGWVDTYPLVSTSTDKYVDQWGGNIRNKKSRQLYAYPSIAGAEGQSCCTGSTFYVYYVKLFPGDKFTDRFLFRRKVTIVPGSGAFNRVELTTYRNGKGQRWSSTEAPEPKSFKRKGGTGYLLAHPVDGWKQVLDCTRRGDHALYAKKCKRGWQPYRRVGYIHPTATFTASVPVYRCLANKRHYASTSIGCDGGRKEARLGYAMTSL